jgi:formate dehydrogenase major subunit
VVSTDSDEVRAARKTALELLISDHTGDGIGPCRTGCPARLDIPNFISRIASGDHQKAAEIVTDDLTLPASLGRVCPRLCEERCRRCEAEEALSIRNLHRFSADHQRNAGGPHVPRKADPTRKRVAIVGAGPAGLAAAHHLLRRGHGTVLFDVHSQPGGMLRYGIPEFRLPRQVLDAEINVIRTLGGEIFPGKKLGRDFTLEELRRDFDAVFLAVGAQGSRGLGCPGEELAMPALEFLEKITDGQPPAVGSDAVIVGGGNTAMDACRCALRLGAKSVRVFYRRTRREMPCLMEEVEAAEAEGVKIEFLVAPVR